MRTFLLSVAVVAVSVFSAAEARTISLGDILAAGGGEVRGARIEVIAPEPTEMLSRAESRDAFPFQCGGVREGFCNARRPAIRSRADTMLAITLDVGFSASKFSFDDAFAGETPEANRSVVVNGIAYQLGDLSTLTLAAGTIFINLDALAAQQLSLRTFDLDGIPTPLPAAVWLMIAGVSGLFLARRKGRRNTEFS